MTRFLTTAAFVALTLSGAAAEPNRCAPLDFKSNEFRNVTEPGDVHILPTDKTVLINKRKPEPTRVIFGRATSAHSPVVIVKDCSGTAYQHALTLSGQIDIRVITIDGNYATQALRRVGNRWMTQ
ncbi:hypothetical protein JQ558_14525 [Bradyrhizobium sp. AUGA SZCCT0160]|nr:hypothetical protein [Bradyrhizobium sp. AUGA SZCCT0160]